MVGFDYFIFLLSSFYNVYIKLFYLFIQLEKIVRRGRVSHHPE